MLKHLNDVANMAAKVMGSPKKSIEKSKSEEVPDSSPEESLEGSKDEAIEKESELQAAHHKAMHEHHTKIAEQHAKMHELHSKREE